MLLERDAVGLDTPEHAQTLNHAQHSSGAPAPPAISEGLTLLAGDHRRCCSRRALLGLTPLIHARTLIPRSTRRANRSPSTIPRAGGVSERPNEAVLKTAARQQCQGPGFESRSRRASTRVWNQCCTPPGATRRTRQQHAPTPRGRGSHHHSHWTVRLYHPRQRESTRSHRLGTPLGCLACDAPLY